MQIYNKFVAIRNIGNKKAGTVMCPGFCVIEGLGCQSMAILRDLLPWTRMKIPLAGLATR